MRLTHTLALLSALAITAAPVAKADGITWTNWNYPGGAIVAGAGTQTGSLTIHGTPVTVTYTGQYDGYALTNWTPETTFSGGGSDNAPPLYNGSVQFTGGQGYTEVITFSSPVTDPVMAIWSLGADQGSPLVASYNFTTNEPFSILSAGPGSPYEGSSPIYTMTTTPGDAYGAEGNGVIGFKGTYSSITFTAPTPEYYSTFTIGSVVPEPSSLALLGTGVLSVVGFARRKFRRA